MLFNKAEMLNRRASNPKFKAGEIIKVLAPQKGAVIADIGCGGGYFTMRLAEAVGVDGKVYAVDTSAKLLAYVKEYARKNQITNIETILADKNGLSLPKRSCDFIFLRNFFHHLKNPVCYFENLKRYLKPGGKVAVIDYKKRAALIFITLMGHYVKEEFIQETMKSAGYVLIESYDFLPEQSFNIFQLTR